MSPRLADIGVTGFQLDVADGGDVDPGTGRLLTIAEMQEALRIVRQQPLPAGHPTPAVTEPGPADPGSAPPGWPDPVDQEPSGADPFGWDTGEGWEPSPDGEELPDTTAVPVAARSGRRQTDDNVETHPIRHRAPVRLLRRVVGLDRAPKAARHGGDDWLPQPIPTESAGTAAPVADEAGAGLQVLSGPRPRRGTRRAGKAASTTVTAGAGANADFEVAAAPRGFTAVFWRWVARLLLLVLVLAGLNAVFVRPFRDTATTAPAVSGVDAAAAAALAARFTADYLSYVSTVPAGNSAALTAQLAGTAGVSRLLFTGTGYVRADLVQTGQVSSVDDTHAMVAVTARLRLATPPAGGGQPGGAAPATPPATPSGAAADPGPVPPGWADLGSRWVDLVVPVETTPTGLRVSAAGPVFSTEPPGQIDVPATTTGIDAATVTATHDVAVAFFTGYAASKVAYLAEPTVSMGGLGGVATLSSVDNWSIAMPSDGTNVSSDTDLSSATSGVGSGSVVWQLAGTELTVAQQYTVAMTHAEGRWYAAALSPTRATTP